MNLKKAIVSIMIVFLAVATGFSVGKIYLNSTTIQMEIVDETEEELREAEATVLALVARAENGEAVENFDAVELYQIAEYKLNNSSSFLKELVGVANSTGQDISIKSQKIKMDNKLVFYKLSPSKTVVGIKTPNICNRITYNLSNENKIMVANGDASCLINTTSKETLDAIFSSHAEKLYTKETFLAEYKTTPKTSVLPYIISSKTCTEENYSSVVKNADGTYTFQFSLAGDALNKSALYYTYEILSTCGYRNPSLSWKKVKFSVTINGDFTLNKIEYVEDYQIASEDIPMLKKATVKDTFVDTFFFDEQEILNRAFSDYEIIKENF